MERDDNIFDRDGKNDLHWTCTLFHNGKFYMFYNYGMAQSGPAPYMTGMAWSEDGKIFDIRNDLIFHPDYGNWDGRMAEVHSIIRADGMWRMYYCGYDETNWRIGVAYSEDLNEWKKHPDYILDIGDAEWENIHVADPHVIFFKGRYLMYYMGKGDVWQVGLAESHDGIMWDKHMENPIIKANEKWCDGCICLSGIINYKGRLISTIHGYDSEEQKFTTKLMESNNGIKWSTIMHKDSTEHKEIELEIPPGEWNNRGIVHPELLNINNKFVIYYTGIRRGNPNQHRIGRVILDDKDILL